jgi:hypothetical protein
MITRPARDVPVVAEPDVLVVGGGAAGIAAAVSAARCGASTMLAERYGSLGGMATGGLIILLLTMDDGAGHPMVGGVCQELVDRLAARGATYFPPESEWNAADERLVDRYRGWGLVWGRGPHRVRYSVAFDPEEFRFVANEMVASAGARLRLHSWATEPLVRDNRIEAVLFQSKAGPEAVRARVVVDASGDADLVAGVGEAFERERVHPWLWFRMANVQDVEAAIAAARGKFFPTLGGQFFKTPGRGRTLMPWGIADAIDRKIDATDPDELTHAEVECRRLVMEVVDRLRREVPGFEQAYLSDVAWQLGITESRRLVGRYVLRREDEGRVFPDAIALTGNWTKYDARYSIPYRSLLPQRIRNLLVAGRCISVDHRVHHSTKEIPPCMATGEAAGVAAALAARGDGDVQRVDVGRLQAVLRERGAILPAGSAGS